MSANDSAFNATEHEPFHEGNLFFRHKYPSIDIEKAITRISTYKEFYNFYKQDLMDGR